MNFWIFFLIGVAIGLVIALIKFRYDINKTKVDWNKDWGKL